MVYIISLNIYVVVIISKKICFLNVCIFYYNKYAQLLHALLFSSFSWHFTVWVVNCGGQMVSMDKCA